ncbi:hypothetical protein EVAR_102031_1 [Eumeta japonica]|uniref:Uncharacterized protein n=1 Tax=Eumeta variegata TaxID=151549 RepID=A0A4C1U099_EUMVA|nr:hypothetical protein EVAR_102031_1 [Eumeta japonica]
MFWRRQVHTSYCYRPATDVRSTNRTHAFNTPALICRNSARRTPDRRGRAGARASARLAGALSLGCRAVHLTKLSMKMTGVRISGRRLRGAGGAGADQLRNSFRVRIENQSQSTGHCLLLLD